MHLYIINVLVDNIIRNKIKYKWAELCKCSDIILRIEVQRQANRVKTISKIGLNFSKNLKKC